MVAARPRAGQEFLDLVDHAIDVADPHQVVAAGKLGIFRAGDVPGEILPAAGIHPDVVAAMQHQRRDPHGGEQRAHVDLGIHAAERDRRGRTRADALIACPPFAEMRPRQHAGRECGERLSRSPGLLGAFDENLQLGGRQHPGEEMRVGAVEHQRARAFRIGRGEQDRHRPAFRGAEQHGALRANRVHHGAHVVHPGLEVRQMMRVDPVGKPGAALVEQDEAAEGTEPPQQMGVARVLPMDVQVGDEAGHEHQVDRPVADHLIGDPNITASGVTGLGRLQRRAPRSAASSGRIIAGPSGSAKSPSRAREATRDWLTFGRSGGRILGKTRVGR